MKENVTLLQELKVNEKATQFLKEIGNWSTFLSILGFIGLGFLVVLAIIIKFVLGDTFNAQPNYVDLPFNFSTLLSILYLIFALIYFFPVKYLYSFSKKIKEAIIVKNEHTFADALEMLKSHYKFWGVFSIIIISLYVLIFIGAIIFSTSIF